MAGQLPARVRQAGENYVSLLQVTRCVYADRVTAGYLSVQLRLSRRLGSGKDRRTAWVEMVTQSDTNRPLTDGMEH
jgi:hypothetical protein